MINVSEDFSDVTKKPASIPSRSRAALTVHLEWVALQYDVINYLLHCHRIEASCHKKSADIYLLKEKKKNERKTLCQCSFKHAW